MRIANELSVTGADPSEWKGLFCSENKPSVKKISLRQEWDALWRSSLNPPAPAVDFGEYFAAAVFLGAQTTGGYGVEFLDPMSDDASVRVRYKIRKPAPGAFVIQSFTQPYAIKLYHKTPLDVSIAEER